MKMKDTSLQDLAEFAADLLAEARSLRDRLTDLENDGIKTGVHTGMTIREVVDAADQLYMAAGAVARALDAEADFDDWGERWLPR